MKKELDITTIFLLFLFFVYENSFYGCNLIDSTLQGRSRYVVSILLIVYLIFNRNTILLPKDIRRCFWGITLIPFLSFFNCNILQGQSFDLSLLSWLGHNAHFLFLFVLIGHKIKTNEIIVAIRWYAIIYSILSILQVLVPSTQFLFASYFEDGSLFMRNDMIRIVMPGVSFVLFAYIESLYRYLRDGNKKYIILFTLFLVTIYLRQTRQLYMAIAIVSTIMAIHFYYKTRRKGQILAFVAILLSILIANFDSLFSSFITQTKDEFNDANYNRWVSYDYFFNEIFSNFFVLLFGMGKAALNTQYASKIEDLWIYSGISRNDVGIVGEWYNFGIFYVLVYLKFCYCIIKKYAKEVNPLVRFFVICTLCHCMFIFPLDDAALWACIFYISMKSITNYDNSINSHN